MSTQFIKWQIAMTTVLAIYGACKPKATSSIKGGATSCDQYQAKIDQATKGLEGLQAPVPADSSSTDSTAQLALGGAPVNCDNEARTEWLACMRPICLNYLNTRTYYQYWSNSATDCNSDTGIQNAALAGTIKEDGSCTTRRNSVYSQCIALNNTPTKTNVNFVCVSSQSTTGTVLYRWQPQSDAINPQSEIVYTGPNGVRSIPNDPSNIQALSAEECKRLFIPQNGSSDQTAADMKRRADAIARFTNDLTVARSDLKQCIAEEKRRQQAQQQQSQQGQQAQNPSTQQQQATIQQPEDCTTKTPKGMSWDKKQNTCTCPDGLVPIAADCSQNCGPLTWNPDTQKCSNYSECKDGYSWGSDGRCYKNVAQPCKADEYETVSGTCKKFTPDMMGKETSCPDGKILTVLKTCVDDSKYSAYGNNYQ